MPGLELVRTTRDEALMRTAQVWAAQSTCDRAHVGCVIAREGRTLASGYNGAPAGMPHCEHNKPVEEIEYSWGLRNGCKIAVHAEANALAFAARHGVATEGAWLYTTLSPCYECAKLIINAGILAVVCEKQYRDPAGLTLLKAAKVSVVFVQWS